VCYPASHTLADNNELRFAFARNNNLFQRLEHHLPHVVAFAILAFFAMIDMIVLIVPPNPGLCALDHIKCL